MASSGDAPSGVLYEGFADILMGMADPEPRVEEEVGVVDFTTGEVRILQRIGNTVERAPHLLQITLLASNALADAASASFEAGSTAAAPTTASQLHLEDAAVEPSGPSMTSDSEDGPPVSAALLPGVSSHATAVPVAASATMPVPNVALSPGGPGSDTASLPSYLVHLPAGSEASLVYRTSMRGVPVRGLIMGGHFVMDPDVAPGCTPVGSGDSGVLCSVAGQQVPFHSTQQAREAVLQAIAEGVARMYEESAHPLPVPLRRRLSHLYDSADGQVTSAVGTASRAGSGTSPRAPLRQGDEPSVPQPPQEQARTHVSPHGARRAYVNPIYNHGQRSVLAVRVLFYGQALSAACDANEARMLLGNVTAELTRSALGVASFSWVVPPAVVTLPVSLPACSSNFASVETAAKAAILAQQGYNPADYSHFVVLLPQCSSLGWLGLAYVSGTTAWVNGASSEKIRTLTHELGEFMSAQGGGFHAP
jgi:hypothetical protein